MKIRGIVRLVAFGAFAATFVVPIASLARDSSHDFDFEFGSWRAHLMVRRPLSNTRAWKQFDGTSTVRKVWNGKANLGELEVAGPSGKIEAFSLRLYDPPTREWHVYFATSESGSVSVPAIGHFENGRGLFYDREMFAGKPVRVRFAFSRIIKRSFAFLQAYSKDEGKTWTTNWIATFVR